METYCTLAAEGTLPADHRRLRPLAVASDAEAAMDEAERAVTPPEGAVAPCDAEEPALWLG